MYSHSIRVILRNLITIDKQMSRAMAIIHNSPTKRTSSKSKLKQKKASPNAKYKSSKPIKSQAVSTFRNKSNLR